MNQIWESSEKSNFGPILAHLAQTWAFKIFFVDFTPNWCYTLSQATIVCNFMENVWSKLKKMAKNRILGLI